MENLLIGLEVAFTLQNLAYLFIGVLIGTAIGVLPGLGPAASISMLLPITFTLDPISSIIMLSGLYYGTQYGGSTTSILFNIPGENTSVMTCIDGHAMTKLGKGGTAIAAAAISSFIAGLIMIVLMAIISPPLSEIAFRFGPAEYSLLMLLGLSVVVLFTSENIIKGFAAILVGILFGFIGTDYNSGTERFTFGIPDLYNGIGFTSAAIGLFAMSEIIKNIKSFEISSVYQGKIKVFISKEDFKQIIPPAIRGSAIGGLFGLIPGATPAATYSAYVFDKQVSKNKNNFGKGAIEGVAAPEAANNAAAQAGFIPLLSLGIPDSAVMALLLASMIMSGIVPGPLVISKHPDLFWGLLVSMILGNFILLILNFPLIKIWLQILKIPYHLLYPLILIFCCIGIYSINNNINDIFFMLIFAIIGYIYMILKISPVPTLLGFILGAMLEDSLRRALTISQGNFNILYKNDIGIALIIAISMIIIFGICKFVRRNK
jgi:TctA family transporter